MTETTPLSTLNIDTTATKADVMLQVQNLNVLFQYNKQATAVVSNINFALRQGKTLGLVGESGSGKSLTALSIMQLLPTNARVSGSIHYQQHNLLRYSDARMQQVRGHKISMIFQEPMSALNPLQPIGKQISEVLELHLGLRSEKLQQRVLELLELVGIQEAERRLTALPHELSGGQRQRVVIAMALACEPEILIADEPTTALDVTIQQQIVTLLMQLQKRLGMAILFISHDLNLVRQISDDICIMRAGRIIEHGASEAIFENPQHDYTKALIDAEPNGAPHSLADTAKTLLSVEQLNIWFPIKKGLFAKTVGHIKAVTQASFRIQQGETLGLVGESGSGKTTLALALLKLQESEGSVQFQQQTVSELSQTQFRALRKEMQMVFQDPFGSLSPRMSIAEIVGEGLTVHYPQQREEHQQQIIEALIEVGIDPEQRHRYPHEFSGGQRQRIAIARALVLKPTFMVLDEPTSALDRTVQSQIIELLRTLQHKYNLSYLFISHDLAVVRAMSHRVIVMQQGQIVEQGLTQQIFETPAHPYTQALIQAAAISSKSVET